MSTGVSVEKKPFDLFTKWSEGHLDLLNRRQQMLKEASDSFLGVVRESFEMKVPEESLKKLSGNMLALCKLPLNTLGDHAGLDAYSSEFKKLVAGMPAAISGNGFSEEFKQYGKASWGKRLESAFRMHELDDGPSSKPEADIGPKGSRRGREELPGGDRVVPQEVRRLLDGSGRGGQRAHEARSSEGSVPRPAGTVKNRLTGTNRVIHHPLFNFAPGLVDDPFLRPLQGRQMLAPGSFVSGYSPDQTERGTCNKGGSEKGVSGFTNKPLSNASSR